MLGLGNVLLQHNFQCSNCFIFVSAICRDGNNTAGNNTQGHNTQTALGFHRPLLGFQPNPAGEFICLLHEVCSLTVMQAGFATNDDFFIEHMELSVLTHMHGSRCVWVYNSQIQLKSQQNLAFLHNVCFECLLS